MTQYLDYKLHDDSEYVAMCDMAEKVSCSAVISSEYSKLFSLIGLIPKESIFDVPNANYGLVFYSGLLVIYIYSSFIPYAKTLVLLAASASAVLSLVLLYIMVVILQDVCVVCMCTHLCNAAILSVAVMDFNDFRNKNTTKNKRS